MLIRCGDDQALAGFIPIQGGASNIDLALAGKGWRERTEARAIAVAKMMADVSIKL